MKRLFTFSLLCLFASAGMAQTPARQCATPLLYEGYEKWLQGQIMKDKLFANAKKASSVYTIPVIVHIIHDGQNPGTSRNISQAQVNSQIDVLNKDFRRTNTDYSITPAAFQTVSADCEVQFCLAYVDPTGAVLPEAGIDRINTTTRGWNPPPYQGLIEPGRYIDTVIKKQSYWDPEKYFNIWVLEMNDGVLGYAQFPDVPVLVAPQLPGLQLVGGPAYSDGVVIDYRDFGTTGVVQAPYNKGRTATHEIGHWLGLRHIWGDANCGDDYCNDTPTQTSPTTNCPTYPAAVSCSGTGSTGKMFYNYMDYSYDACLTMFTQDQKDRMVTCMQNSPRRVNLAGSDVCMTTSIKKITDNSGLSIYPNPAAAEVVVKVNYGVQDDAVITVYNVLGEVVLQRQQVDISNTSFQLDMSQARNGMYYIHIHNSQLNITRQLVMAR